MLYVFDTVLSILISAFSMESSTQPNMTFPPNTNNINWGRFEFPLTYLHIPPFPGLHIKGLYHNYIQFLISYSAYETFLPDFNINTLIRYGPILLIQGPSVRPISMNAQSSIVRPA